MKRGSHLFFVIALFMSCSSIVKAQGFPTASGQSGRKDLPPSPVRVAKALECSEREYTSEWKVERGEPITGSKNVLVEYYTFGGRRVKVAIIDHQSESKAVEMTRQGLSTNKPAKIIPNLGDDGLFVGL